MNNTTDPTDHHSSEGVFQIFKPTFAYPVSACYILIASVAAVGNSLVCFAILANKSLRNNPTNLFLFSLALSDLLTATLAMPFDIESIFLQFVWRHGKILCISFHTAFLITVPTSILTLLVIGVDRYKTLSDPLGRFRRAQFMTPEMAVIVIVIVWVYCIFWASLPRMGWPWLVKGRKVIYKGYCMVPYSKLYSTMNTFLNFVAPVIITCVFFIMIFRIARNHHNRSVFKFGVNGPPRQPSKDETRFYARNLKAAKTTAMFVVAFLICWQPYSYFSIVSNLYGGDHWKPYPVKLYMILLMLGYLNSALNPFLFAFRNKRFQATYVKLFKSTIRPGPSSTIRRRSTISLRTLSSEIPETESKAVRLQSIRRTRETPDAPRRHGSNSAQ